MHYNVPYTAAKFEPMWNSKMCGGIYGKMGKPTPQPNLTSILRYGIVTSIFLPS